MLAKSIGGSMHKLGIPVSQVQTSGSSGRSTRAR
jgi:hypothetical protein